MIQKLHDKGLRSEHAYTAGFVSIGLSVAAWAASLAAEPGRGLDRADRWGIFVGEWAPTFFGLGVALSQYEQQDGSLAAEMRSLQERERQTV
ncbi:hypothetical protein KBZ10_10455 [Streptomyces sp. F63]|uniref:hypothetical protein n=1 Tax=Streptomyces sp. F63 TaxID=2824887 RepID=UPI001B38227B|nr:hypothetical protein [Streptomyces sp. F63]MBQ0984930.1 hypothetical protein [Streptomyces sp. F63]